MNPSVSSTSGHFGQLNAGRSFMGGGPVDGSAVSFHPART
jgi:hypothetical protein